MCTHCIVIQSSVDGLEVYLHVLAVATSATVNIRMHASFLAFSSFLDTCPGVGLLNLFSGLEEPPYYFPDKFLILVVVVQLLSHVQSL